MNSAQTGGERWLNRVTAVSVLILAALLTACAPVYQGTPAPIYTPSPAPVPPSGTYPEPATEAMPEEEQAPTYEIAPVESSPGSAGKAVDSLLEEAWGHYRRDDFDRAIAIAERAQRLNPRAAEVYLVLASAYLGQGKEQLAGQFARRGISYSAAGSALRRRLQAVMAQLSP